MEGYWLSPTSPTWQWMENFLIAMTWKWRVANSIWWVETSGMLLNILQCTGQPPHQSNMSIMCGYQETLKQFPYFHLSHFRLHEGTNHSSAQNIQNLPILSIILLTPYTPYLSSFLSILDNLLKLSLITLLLAHEQWHLTHQACFYLRAFAISAPTRYSSSNVSP